MSGKGYVYRVLSIPQVMLTMVPRNTVSIKPFFYSERQEIFVSREAVFLCMLDITQPVTK